MADVVGTFDEVKDHDGGNIRKVLRMAVFVAPWETAPAITSLVNADNELVIPDTYESVGIMDKESAFSATPSITVSEVSGYGYGQTLRRDMVTRNTTIAFTMLETRRVAFELYYGIDLSTVTATAAPKNEITFDEPDRPETRYYRVLCVGADGDGANTLFIADLYPKATVSEVAALASSETEARRYGVTMGVDVDTIVGTGHRQFLAGPGLSTADITAMGWTRAA
jgi:hypothetical protein